jgi:hypothetical protein
MVKRLDTSFVGSNLSGRDPEDYVERISHEFFIDNFCKILPEYYLVDVIHDRERQIKGIDFIVKNKVTREPKNIDLKANWDPYKKYGSHRRLIEWKDSYGRTWLDHTDTDLLVWVYPSWNEWDIDDFKEFVTWTKTETAQSLPTQRAKTTGTIYSWVPSGVYLT